MRIPISIAACVALAATLPIPAQSDDQTKELLEKERRYYEQQMAKEKAEAEQKASDDDTAGDEAKVRAFLAEADRLIRDKNYDSRSTAHYKVQTDDPRVSPGSATLLLESFRSYFADFWSGKLPLHEYDATSRIFLFYSYFKYNQLLTGQPRFDELQSTGHYRAFYDVVVVHTDSLGSDALEDTLVHEAAHQLIGQEIYGGRPEQLHWLSEGMGAYFGYTAQDRDGTFLPGVIGPKVTSVFRDQRSPPGSAGPRRLQDYRSLVKKGKAKKPSEVVSLEAFADFYGPGLQENYTVSWLLVHYLLNGEEGALQPPFVQFLQRDAAEGADAAAFYETIGRSPEELDAGFLAYVAGLKNKPQKR